MMIQLNSIRIIVDVILDAIQAGASKRVEAPTRRKDITPVAQEPDFIDQEDEPEVTLPEGYDEADFDDKKSNTEKNTSEDTEDQKAAASKETNIAETDSEKKSDPKES